MDRSIHPRTPLEEMIFELRRELSARETVYPWLIRNKKLTKALQEERNNRMTAAVNLLERVAEAAGIKTPSYPERMLPEYKGLQRAS